MLELLAAVAAGFVVAAVGTPAGVSGAVFLLPVQISVLGLAGPAVSATNLLFNVVSTPLSLRRLRRYSSRMTGATAVVVAIAVPAAALGVLARVGVLAEPGRFRVVVAAVLLPWGSMLLWRAGRTPRVAHAHRQLATTPADPGGGPLSGQTTLAVLTALAAGLGAALGIGGGSILASALVVLTPRSTRTSALLALTATLTTSITGLITYTVLGAAHVGTEPVAPYWGIGIALGCGGMLGGLVGSSAQPYLSDRLLTATLGTVATATALSYLFGT